MQPSLPMNPNYCTIVSIIVITVVTMTTVSVQHRTGGSVAVVESARTLAGEQVEPRGYFASSRTASYGAAC